MEFDSVWVNGVEWRPRVIVEIAFTARPADDASVSPYLILNSTTTAFNGGALAPAPEWHDVTDDCLSINYKRGRSSETDEVDIGTATLVLDNADAQYDPTNPGSPYWVPGLGSSVRPMRQVRIRGDLNGQTWFLFRGYVEDYGFDLGTEPTVSVSCVDALALFAALTLDPVANPIYPNDRTGWRVDRMADAVGWPETLRDIAPGLTVMSGTKLGDNCLSLMQRAMSAELGMLFVDGDGMLRFLDRLALFTEDRSTTSQCVFADDGDFPEYDTLEPSYGVQDVSNIITGKRSSDDAITQVAMDQPSIDEFGKRSRSIDDLDVLTDYDVQYQVQWLLARFKNPALRIKSLSCELLTQPQFFNQVMGLTLWDRITVRRTYSDTYTFDQDLWIEGIEVDISPDSWKLTLSTSRVANASRPFVLNSSRLDGGFVGY